MRTRVRLSLLFVVAALGTSRAAPAAEVQWRHDYNAARREAEEKGRPLCIDFGTENCFWCKRLDASTFRDPAVIALLNDKFIPLKIDAEREAQLAQSLRIQSYPTVVMASGDGRILNTVVGFKEAPEFKEVLVRSLGALAPAPPDAMAHDFKEATKAMTASEYAKAVMLLKAMLEDGKDRPIQQKARQMLRDLEQQAAGQLERAKQMEDRGQTAEAVHGLTDLIRAFSGTQAAGEASTLLTTLASKPDVKNTARGKRARELLAQAREDYRTQQYLCCLDRCDVLAAGYADLPEGHEARQLAGEIKNNPEWMRQACESLSERLGSLYLSLAETWLHKGQPQQAALCLERVVQTFPGTRQAEAATVRLAYIKGQQPTMQAEFKKP